MIATLINEIEIIFSKIDSIDKEKLIRDKNNENELLKNEFKQKETMLELKIEKINSERGKLVNKLVHHQIEQINKINECIERREEDDHKCKLDFKYKKLKFIPNLTM
jgi:hypothetical protein